MDVSPASREKRRGVHPVSPRPGRRGAGGESVSEDRVCPSDPIPGKRMLQPQKVTKAPLQSAFSLGDSHPSPNYPGQPGNARCQPKECLPKRERCGALAPPEFSLPAAPHPSSLVKPTVRRSGSRGIARAKRLEARARGCGSGCMDSCQGGSVPGAASGCTAAASPVLPGLWEEERSRALNREWQPANAAFYPCSPVPIGPHPSRSGASPPPASLRCGWGSYLSGVHFGVFRCCTMAQTVQKHHQ